MIRIQPVTIGERLKAVRLENKISLSAAGRHVGRSRQSIAGWEAGTVEIRVAQLALLADLYKVTTDYLIYGRESAPGSIESYEKALAEMLAAVGRAKKPR